MMGNRKSWGGGQLNNVVCGTVEWWGSWKGGEESNHGIKISPEKCLFNH